MRNGAIGVSTSEENRAGAADDEELERALEELESAADRLRLPPVGAMVDGRYRVVDKLGQGGFGWVFAVRHRVLDQRFAMKILHPRISRDENWVTRFREEARATSLIGHENIVFVTDFDECPEYGYYLVMEYLEGQSLHQVLLDERRLPVDRVMQFALAAGSALSAVHDLGIVHCDLKPSNIMRVARPNRPSAWKILDFGTSSLVMGAVETDELYGTPRYMAPEQAVGLEVDHRADQFSLGCVIYEMLTGRAPWNTKRWEEATAAYRKKTPPKPSELVSELPAAVDNVILRSLEMRPSHRWPNVDAFVEALQSEVDVSLRPTHDPLDVRRGDVGFERSMTSPTVARPKKSAGDSMTVIVEDSEDFKEVPSVRVVFRTPSRLQREMRRNLVAGGLFIPSDELLPIDSEVIVDLFYEPRTRGIQLDARVVSHVDVANGQTFGYGVAFEAGQDRALRRFLQSLDLSHGLSQDDVIRRFREAELDDDLNAGEAFLISRVTSPMPIGRARAMFSGLPFEVEDVIAGLLEKGYLELDRGGAAGSSAFYFDGAQRRDGDFDVKTAVRQLSVDESTGSTDIEFSRDEIRQVLELVSSFRERNNYLAAFDILEKTTNLAPDVDEFHFELAELYLSFRNDPEAAREAIERALELDPNNPAYRAFRSELE